MLLNVKNDSLIVKFSKSQKSFLNIHSIKIIILSMIGTPTYKPPKILVLVTQNKFRVQDSFTFVDKILTQDSDLHMASLDIDALFTKIPSK